MSANGKIYVHVRILTLRYFYNKKSQCTSKQFLWLCSTGLHRYCHKCLWSDFYNLLSSTLLDKNWDFGIRGKLIFFSDYSGEILVPIHLDVNEHKLGFSTKVLSHAKFPHSSMRQIMHFFRLVWKLVWSFQTVFNVQRSEHIAVEN